MPRVKILCLIDTLEKGGGAERLLVDLLPALRQRGIDVAAAPLLRGGDDHSAELECAGVPVHHLDLTTIRAWPQARRKLHSLVRDHGYTTFWGHLYYGNLYAVLARRLAGQGRALATLHSSGLSRATSAGLSRVVAKWLEKRILSSADIVVAVSNAVRRDYESAFGLGGVKVVHNGINYSALQATALVDRGAVRASFGIAADDFLLVTPASLIEIKGHEILIEAIDTLSDAAGVRVLMCGDGPLRPMLAAEITRRGLRDRITMSPIIPHNQLMALIAAADGLVLPSRQEAFGIAAVEAMALGVPCVLSNVDGLREVTGGQTCASLVPPDDPHALAHAIEGLRSEPLEAAGRAERARAHVRATFDIGACADRWAALLEGQSI